MIGIQEKDNLVKMEFKVGEPDCAHMKVQRSTSCSQSVTETLSKDKPQKRVCK